MKKIYMLAFAAMAVLASCDKETEDNSFVTTYPVLEVSGDDFMVVEKGSTFTDPGVIAKVGDQTVEYTTSGTVDTDTPGLYELTYTAVNSDGYTASVSRQVAVNNYSNMEGVFSTTIVRQDGKTASGQVVIVDLGNGYYSCTDLFGGYYSIGKGYGDDYAAVGQFAVDKTTSPWTISLGDKGYAQVAGWGDGIDDVNGTYDPATEVLSFATDYAGYTFTTSNN